jgi:hypothetical protein
MIIDISAIVAIFLRDLVENLIMKRLSKVSCK